MHFGQIIENSELRRSESLLFFLKTNNHNLAFEILNQMNVFLFHIFGLVLVAEGVVLVFNKIFNHKILKQALFSTLRFEGVSFNQIREYLYVFMFAMGTALVIFCGFGYFNLGTRSKSLRVSVSTYFFFTFTK